MGRAKEIIVRVIPAKIANDFIRKHHYSGKIVNNSVLHFGAFLDDRLHGAMSFGSPLDKRKVLGLVEGTKWNEMLELNRMAFDEYLPRNSESRCISIALKLIRKNAPQVKWVLSFADGTQCGDGAIYRASGFMLTGLKKNNQIWFSPDNEITTRIVATDSRRPERERLLQRISITKGKHIIRNGAASMQPFIEAGWKPKPGFQLRYIYLIDKSCKLTVPIIPFDRIDQLNAGMYKGQKITLAARRAGSIDSDAPPHQGGEGGAEPTPAL